MYKLLLCLLGMTMVEKANNQIFRTPNEKTLQQLIKLCFVQFPPLKLEEKTVLCQNICL